VRFHDRDDGGAGYTQMQVETSSNVGGSWLCFMNGGLNYQIEHHIFPRVHHGLYPRLQPIVRRFCEAKGWRYTHFPTVGENVLSMVRHLRKMGASHGERAKSE